MKYCRKCGMLLEDTISTCIRCGTDVSSPENVSLYPPGVMETMDAQKEERKKHMKTIIMIICIFVALVIIVAVGAAGIANGSFAVGQNKEPIPKQEVVEEINNDTSDSNEALDVTSELQESQAEEQANDDASIEGVADEELDESEDSDSDASKVVNDANGLYYNYQKETDDAGNVIFEAVYPEDLTEVTFTPNYDRYMDRFPIGMSFSASNKEGTLNFTYISPQKLWYKNSETGKSKSDVRDPSYYMSYYEYGGAKGYIEAMLNSAYPKAKIELVNETDINDKAPELLGELSKAKSKELFGSIGDYAHIGADTTYANMDAEYSACIYEYEITTSDKQMVFDKFYVPIMSNNLYYASESANDRGTVTEWYFFAFAVMEAGNEDLYDDYSEDFDLFIANSIPTNKFMYINQLYTDEIEESIDSLRAVDPLTKEMLSDYGKEADKGIKLDSFNKKVMEILAASSDKKYENGDNVIYVPDKINAVYVDEKNNKLFISTKADEYPGESYMELKENKGDDIVATEEADATDDDSKEDEEFDATSNKKPNSGNAKNKRKQ